MMNADRFSPPPGRGKTICPECGKPSMSYDSTVGSARCHRGSCSTTAKRLDDGRWRVSGDGSTSGSDADDWIADVTATFATSTARAAGAGLRIALALTPIIAVGGTDSIAPGFDWLSEQIGSGLQIVRNGLDWLTTNGLLVEHSPATRRRPATYSAHTVNATQRGGKLALREYYLQWTANPSSAFRRIAPHVLRRDGVSVAAMQGWALLVLHGPQTGAEMSRLSKVPLRPTQRRLAAAVAAGLAVETTTGAAKWYRLADADEVADVADAAQARVASGVERNARAVAIRRDRDARSRAAWNLEAVAIGIAEYVPAHDERIEHLSPGEHERVAVIASACRPPNHPLRRLLGTPHPATVERVAVDVIAGVVLGHPGYRPVARRDVALVDLLSSGDVDRLIDEWRRRGRVDRDEPVVTALYRRRRTAGEAS